MENVEVDGKIVGLIDGEFYKTVRKPKLHFFRKRQGYPISISVLDKLKARGVKKILIEEIERNDGRIKKYECFVSDYDFIEPFKEDGYDLQKCIPLRRMKVLV